MDGENRARMTAILKKAESDIRTGYSSSAINRRGSGRYEFAYGSSTSKYGVKKISFIINVTKEEESLRSAFNPITKAFDERVKYHWTDYRESSLLVGLWSDRYLGSKSVIFNQQHSLRALGREALKLHSRIENSEKEQSKGHRLEEIMSTMMRDRSLRGSSALFFCVTPDFELGDMNAEDFRRKLSHHSENPCVVVVGNVSDDRRSELQALYNFRHRHRVVFLD